MHGDTVAFWVAAGVSAFGVVDHRDPMTTSHLPGGEPEPIFNDQGWSCPEGDAP
jgi:hypothetical protein